MPRFLMGGHVSDCEYRLGKLLLWKKFNPKEGSITRSLLRNKLMTNEVSLGLIPKCPKDAFSLLWGVSFRKDWGRSS